jgi:acetyl-CoA carboxylase biotin carboxyl carrier protein
MDFKQIQELIKTINKSNIGELSIEEQGFKIVIKQKKEKTTFVANPPYTPPTVVVAEQPAAAVVAAASTSAPAAATHVEENKNDNYFTIKSPMIGTFYRRTAPDKPMLIEVGDEVRVGQSVCVIEAMKLFNDIESEVNGTIVKILVDDSSPVEYDQPLFLVETK